MLNEIPIEQLHDVISWNDATMQGLLITFLLVMSAVIFYLFKINQKMYKEFTKEREKMYSDFSLDREKLYKDHIAEIRQFNDLLVKITTQYYEVSNNFLRYNR